MVRLLGTPVPDRFLDLALSVAVGVALLSGAAWLVSRFLPRRPESRPSAGPWSEDVSGGDRARPPMIRMA